MVTIDDIDLTDLDVFVGALDHGGLVRWIFTLLVRALPRGVGVAVIVQVDDSSFDSRDIRIVHLGEERRGDVIGERDGFPLRPRRLSLGWLPVSRVVRREA